jgi:5'-nucleotidase
VRPLILLTNDDGLDSPGLWAVAEGLARFADLVICAPDGDASGSSAAVRRPGGFDSAVRVRPVPVDRPGFGGHVRAFALSAPPAACVWMGMEALAGRRPDLVVSGINKGPNLGSDVVVSGTCGAILFAQSIGLSGLAVSTTFADPDYRAAATAGAAVARTMLRAPLPEAIAVNLNVPSGEVVRSVAITKRSHFSWFAFNRAVIKQGPDGMEIHQEVHNPQFRGPAGTDAGAWAAGTASLTLLEPRPAPAWAEERLAELKAAIPVVREAELA